MRKYVRKFVRFVSAFPFIGKVAIRPAVRKFFRAKPEEKGSHMAGLSSLLGFFVFGHTNQALGGIAALKKLSFVAIRFKWFWRLVFIGYTTANVAVTLVRVYLLMYCLYLYWNQRRTGLIGVEDDDFTIGEITLMLVVTLGGQILFMTGSGLVHSS